MTDGYHNILKYNNDNNIIIFIYTPINASYTYIDHQ